MQCIAYNNVGFRIRANRYFFTDPAGSNVELFEEAIEGSTSKRHSTNTIFLEINKKKKHASSITR